MPNSLPNPIEYFADIDGQVLPGRTAAWTVASPDATVWGPTISTTGVITMTSGASAGTTAVVIGLSGLKWTIAISNGGILTLTESTALTASDLAASITDSNSVTWTLYVDDDDIVNVTTSDLLKRSFKYWGVSVYYTPASSTDIFAVQSVKCQVNVRRP